MNNLIIRVLVLLGVIVIGLILFFSGFRVINDGYMGVEVAAIGKHRVLPEPLPAGWYWRRPLMIRIFPYSIREQAVTLYNEKLTTEDKKIILTSMAVYYQLLPENLVAIHQRFGNGHELSKKIEYFSKSTLETVVKDFAREKIFQVAREAVSEQILRRIKDEFEPIGVKINNVVFNSLQFPEQYSEEIAKNYPAYTTMAAVEKSCQTQDQKRLLLNFQVYYHIEPQDAEYVHNRLGTGYLKSFIVPKTKSIADDVLIESTLDSIYQRTTREVLVRRILETVRAQMEEYRIKIDDLAIESIAFEREYQKTLDEIQNMQKQIEMMALTAELESKKNEIEKTRKSMEQELKLKEAQTEQNTEILRAEGIKKSEILKAEGQAEALLKMQKVLADNPELLKFLYIDKISDKVQVMVVPSGDSSSWMDVLNTGKSQKGE